MILKANRGFLIEAARAEPALAKAFAKTEFQSLNSGFSELEFTKLAAKVREGELRGVALMLQEPITYQELGLSDIDAPAAEPSFSSTVANKIVQFGFLRNDTLNRHNEMLENSIAKITSGDYVATDSQPRRPVSLSPRNVVGRNIVSILSSSIDENFYRMKETIETLRKPISFEAVKN